MRIPTLAMLLIPLCVAPAVPTSAQGLADVAKQEEARRGKEDKRDSPKVYTNKDLRGGSPASAVELKTTPVPSPAPTPAAGTASEPPAAAGSKSDAKGDVKEAKNEQYWRKRTQALRDQLERDGTLADALQSRVNALTADVISRDDPAQRAKLSVDRQKALAELERLKAAVSDGTKAIADLEEEARRAGVPPGWLR